jgi:hypothetical protein
MWKNKVSFSYDDVTGHTTVRVKKSLCVSFVEALKKKDDFAYVTSNRMNHCFIFRGTAEEAKTAFEAHLNAF